MIASDLVYEDDFTTGAAAQQIQSYNYSPNNVNTIYPNEKFNKKAPTPNHDAPSGGCPSGRNAAQVAVYTNEPDSHSGSQAGDWEEDEELITVSSKTARGIRTIKAQKKPPPILIKIVVKTCMLAWV